MINDSQSIIHSGNLNLALKKQEKIQCKMKFNRFD